MPSTLDVAFGKATDGSERSRFLVIAIGALLASGTLLYLTSRASGGFPRALTLVSGTMLSVVALQGFIASHYNLPRRVVVAGRHAPLTISQPATLSTLVSTGISLSLITAIHIRFDPVAMSAMDAFERRATQAMVLVGVGVLVHEMWSLRVSAGLTLGQELITGVRYGPRVHLRWDQVLSAHVTPGRRGSVIALHTESGTLRIPGRTVGGDVYAVASVIDYYLRHPEERHRLTDGVAAVKHVDAEYRAGRYRRV